MIQSLLTFAALSALSLRAQAEPPKPQWTLTGNAGLFSDYRYRGFTQTAYQPSFQGGFDVAHRSGFYFGIWNANVEPSLYRGATLEMDIYGGYKFPAGPLGIDLGAITYRYPTHADTGKVGAVHHEEIYASLTYGIATVKFSYQLSNYFGLGDGTAVDTKGSSYLDLGAAHDLGRGWGLNAHFGHQTIRHATDSIIGLKATSVDDYKVGVTKDLKGWAVSLSWIGTSRKDYFITGVSATEAAGRGAVVAGFSRTF
jgi:uncharacterized protein (TIGR02001 family)